MRMRRTLYLAAIAVLALMVALGIMGASPDWLGARLPLSEMERMFLDGWRTLDSRGETAMTQTPFAIKIDKSAPAVEEIVVENSSAHQVRNFWFYRADMPNFYSAETILSSTTSGMHSETDKVMALWGLFCRYYYNYNPVSAGGMLMDPPTLFAVTGTAQCNYAACVLASLCEMAGLKTRLVGIQYEEGNVEIAHCIMEVYADGRWICLDPDGHAAYKRADGQWASVADLVADSTPVAYATHAYYPPGILASAYSKGSVEYHERTPGAPTPADRQRDPSQFSLFHHYMRFDLLPGERVEIFPGRKGACFEIPLPVSATGALKWSFVPRNFISGAPHGLLAQNAAISVDGAALVLRRASPQQDASIILPVTCPFLITGAKVVVSASSREAAPLTILPFVRGQLPALEGWRPVGNLPGDSPIVLDKLFSGTPVFGYALKLAIPASGLRIESMDVVTQFQCAPKALPYLTTGANEFLLYSGEPPTAPPAEYSSKGVVGAQFDNHLRIGFALAK